MSTMGSNEYRAICLCEGRARIFWYEKKKNQNSILQTLELNDPQRGFQLISFCIAGVFLHVHNPRWRLAGCVSEFSSFKAKPFIKLSSYHWAKWVLFSPFISFLGMFFIRKQHICLQTSSRRERGEKKKERKLSQICSFFLYWKNSLVI